MAVLRSVGDDLPVLSPSELKVRGNELVTIARNAAIDAVRESMHTEFLAKGVSLQRADLLRWRGKARAAAERWRQVDAAVSELLHEMERTAASQQRGQS